jgi:MinD superfamily P-loop ATPase
MVVDTAPGTHCNVVQGLRSADLALAVTEPTPLGIYDLDLILRLSSTLAIPTKVVMNKATLPGRDVEGVARVAGEYGTEVAAEIPVDRKLFESYVAGTPTVEAYPDSPSAVAFKNLAHLVSQSMKIAVPAQRHA